MSAAASGALPHGQIAQLSQGMALHFHDLGEASQPAVMFLQGSGPGASGWSNFQYNVGAFTDAGYRVLVPDLPGYGFSSKPTDVDYHLDYFSGYLFELLDHLGLASVSIVGNSLGGAIALGMALASPQRVKKLVLMAPGGLAEKAEYFTVPAMQLMGEIFSQGVSRESLASFIRSALVHDPASVNEQLIDQRWEVYQLQNDHVMKTMVVPNMSARLGEIRCPVLVFWGREERMMPESGFRLLAEGLEDVQLLMASRCGHWFMVEHPYLFNHATLGFLAGTSRTGRL